MAYTNKIKSKPCPTFGCKGRVMTDELHRGYNGKVDDKQVCPECIVADFYRRIGRG